MHPDRVVIGADPGDEDAGAAVAELYAPLGGELVETDVDQRRDDQARLQRLPRREDLLHQRDRQRLRGGRRRRRARSPAGSASTTGSARSSCRPGSAGAEAASARTSRALKQLAANSGYHFQLLNAVIEVNELQKRRVVKKLTRHLGSLAGRRVALLGLSFKPDTDDMRDASSLVLAARLRGRGGERQGLRPGRDGPGGRADAQGRDVRVGAGGARRGRRRGAGHRVARVRRARLDRGRGADGPAAARRRAQLPRPRARCGPPASRTRESACQRRSSRSRRPEEG